MRIEIAKLHENLGATIIYVTHDQTEAMTLGTRIVVMKDGVVQQVDTPQNLYTKPCNLFVAGFIGSPQMNFLDAEVKVNGSDVTLSVGGHELPVPADQKNRLSSIKDMLERQLSSESVRRMYMLQLHLQVRMQVLFTLQLTYMSFLELKYSYTSMLQELR